MRPGLRSGDMSEQQNQIEDLQQQIENLNRVLRERNDQIEELRESQDRINPIPGPSHINPTIPPRIVPTGNPAIDIDVECQRGKIPDLIKNLPIFAGNVKQINHWISCADRVVQRYKHLIGTDVYELWLMEVRNKITGEAGDLLASTGTPLDWDKIKNQLKAIYGDKRELSTLLQKLFSLKQSHKSVANFYTAINDCYTGISTHIQMDPQWVHPDELVKFVDKLCLEKFIDGLEEPYSSHVGLLQPSNLPQAFQYANDKANKIARRNGEYDLNTRHDFNTRQPSQPFKFDRNITITKINDSFPRKQTSIPPPRQFHNPGPGIYRAPNHQPGPSRPPIFQANSSNLQSQNPPPSLNRPPFNPNFKNRPFPGRSASLQTRFTPRQNELSNQETVENPDYEPDESYQYSSNDSYQHAEYYQNTENYQNAESEDYRDDNPHVESNFQTVQRIQKLS